MIQKNIKKKKDLNPFSWELGQSTLKKPTYNLKNKENSGMGQQGLFIV